MKTKLTALFTLFVFSLTSTTWAQPPSTVRQGTPSSAPQWLSSQVTVPNELGTIQDSYKGKGNETVILIQDAHAIPDAQRSIQKLIDYFQKEYGVSLVALEGASSKLDPQIFRSFPDKELLQKVFQEYQTQGELAGGTAAAIFNESKSVYHGIEDWGLYEEGLSLYLQAMKNEPEISKKLEGIKQELQGRKTKVYSKKLLEIDSLLEKFYENHSNLLQVLKALGSIKEPVSGSELALLLQEIKRNSEGSQSIEAEVKSTANKIRDFLKSKVTSENGKSRLIAFNEKYQEFQTQRISSEAFSIFLKDLTAEDRLPITVSDELYHLMQNQKRMQDIQGTKFFEDFERYAEEVKKSIFRSDGERIIDEQTKRLHLLERFARLELNHEDWEELNSTLKAIPEHILDLLDLHFKFYEVAKKRDEAFFANLQGLMKKEKQDTGLVVAGGFHVEGLTQQFKARGISYFILAPHMDSVPKETNYRAHMKGEVSWRDYFEVEKGRINLHKAFIRATRDKLLNRSKTEQRKLLKSWRDQIIRDLADRERITEAGHYTPFIDEVLKSDRESVDDQGEKLLRKIDQFIEGLRQFEAKGQLTKENVLKLLQPATTADPPYAVADPTVSLPDYLLEIAKGGDGAAVTLPKFGEEPSVPGTPAVPVGVNLRSEVRGEFGEFLRLNLGEDDKRLLIQLVKFLRLYSSPLADNVGKPYTLSPQLKEKVLSLPETSFSVVNVSSVDPVIEKMRLWEDGFLDEVGRFAEHLEFVVFTTGGRKVIGRSNALPQPEDSLVGLKRLLHTRDGLTDLLNGKKPKQPASTGPILKIILTLSPEGATAKPKLEPIPAQPDTSWTNPQIFSEYEEFRQWGRPAMSLIINQDLLPLIPNNATVLELGAGTGELRTLIGTNLPEKTEWIATDQNPFFLSLPRRFPTREEVAQLPNLPFDNESMALTVDLGMLDTIPFEEFPPALTEIFRVLKPGGRHVHILDLAPNMAEQVKFEAQRGVVLFPHFNEITAGSKILTKTGFLYVDKKLLDQEINRQSTSPDPRSPLIPQMIPLLRMYLQDPENTIASLESTGRLNILLDFERLIEALERRMPGILKGKEPSAMDLFRRRLEKTAAQSRFTIARSGEATGEAIVNPQDLLSQLPAGKNEVILRNGSLGFSSNPEFARQHPGKIRIVTSVLFVVLKKPETVIPNVSASAPRAEVREAPTLESSEEVARKVVALFFNPETLNPEGTRRVTENVIATLKVIPASGFGNMLRSEARLLLDQAEKEQRVPTIVTVDKKLAERAIDWFTGVLEINQIANNLAVAFDTETNQSLLDALRRMKSRIGLAFFGKEMAKGLDRKELQGLTFQFVGNLGLYRPSQAITVQNPEAVPVVNDDLAADYLGQNESLFGVGINRADIEGEPYLEIVEKVVQIASGLLVAERIKKTSDLKNPAKLQEIKAELLRQLFKEQALPDIVSFQNGNLIVNRSYLRSFIVEYLARAEIRKAA